MLRNNQLILPKADVILARPGLVVFFAYADIIVTHNPYTAIVWLNREQREEE
jgi:hypothetical protein